MNFSMHAGPYDGISRLPQLELRFALSGLRWVVFLAVVPFWLGTSLDTSPVAAQVQLTPFDAERAEPFELNGVMIERRKYSIIVFGPQGNVPVHISGGTRIEMLLDRPQIDLNARQLTLELPISAPDGNHENNERLNFPLPSRLFLTAHFAHEHQRDRVMSAPVKQLATYTLHAQPAAASGDLELTGQLITGTRPNQYRLITEDDTLDIRLGNRDARWAGFSILDLEPLTTDVFIRGAIEGESYFADEILFVPVGDPLAREEPELPRCLFIGDTISFNYQRPLREALQGLVNLHHPPTNCAGSENWRHVHRWLGPYQLPGRQWDVIAFNFGLWDDTTDKETYQENLRRTIEQLKKTGAQLIWITSTPIDYGYWTDEPEGTVVPESQRTDLMREAEEPVGRVPGRMRLQNQWAAEVIREFPEIATCDLWQVVANGRNSLYRDWWFDKQFQFDYTQSVPLARVLARYILKATGETDMPIRPMSAHSAEAPELTDQQPQN